MKPTSRHIHLLIITTCVILLAACNEGRQQLMPMQQTMDSVKMWYGQMQGDSMKVKSEQVAHFLQQHEDDQSKVCQTLHWSIQIVPLRK